jgi:hypothetical protein
MKSDRAVAANGRPEAPPERSGPRTELEGLRATYRHSLVGKRNGHPTQVA